MISSKDVVYNTGNFPNIRRALTSEDTLLKYMKPKLVLPEKKEVVSKYAFARESASGLEKDRPKTTEEILDSIFPPRFYEKDGKSYKQVVDREPAYHWEVKELNQRLNDRLKQYGAAEIHVGLCPIRRWLFEQCSNEVLRQVTVNMAERGLMLNMIKDDFVMTMMSYHKLYLSASCYAVRKALIVANNLFEMEKTVKLLTQMKTDQQRFIDELISDGEREVRDEAELREMLDKEHTTECFLLKKKCRVLEAQIRTKLIAFNLSKKTKKKQDVKKYKHKLFKT